MNLSAAHFLQAIEAYVPPALIAPEALARIRALAQNLPPVSRAGFECRLGDRAPVADFVICVLASEAGREILAGRSGFAELPELWRAHPAWQRVRAFCAHWADSTGALAQQVARIWLEFDMGAAPSDLPTPNIFFDPRRSEKCQPIVETGLALLMGDRLPLPLQRNLSLCFDALPPGAHILHVGVMLSRPFAGVRLCVEGIRADELLKYLDAIGWRAPDGVLPELIGTFAGLVDKILLAVDVGGVLGPKLGLECVVEEPERAGVRASDHLFLDRLVSLGVCLPEKRDALLAWPGSVVQEFIWESLFARGFGHFKIVYQAGQPVEAKAYFGFIHAWTKAPWAGTVVRDGFDFAPMTEAIERGVERLCAYAVDGRWRGFPTLAGESDTWVTGFIVGHLLGLTGGQPVISAAQSYLLAARHPTGGWSYHPEVPPDADSTAWCLIALRGFSGLSTADRRAAETFLWTHYTGDGVATFRPDTGIRRYIGARPIHSIAGWTAAHPDVTAAALLAGGPPEGNPSADQVLNLLVAGQKSDGFFDAYWWRGPHYTTTLVLRALAQRGRRLAEPQARRLLRALVRVQLPDGGFGLSRGAPLDPFTTALALESLSHLSYLGGAAERRAAGAALLKAQQADGGWRGDYVLRVPAPTVIDPQGGLGGGHYSLDRDGLFATALACSALDYWRKAEAGEL